MKKIGIVTFHRAINFGAVLQAYALQKYLQEKKYNVEVLDYMPTNEKEKYSLISLKRLKKPKEFVADILYFFKKKSKKEKFKRYIKEYINTSKKNFDERTIETINEDYDICICGSDQVWNCKLLGGLDRTYFLNFGSNKFKKISYAPSIGNDGIKENFKEEIKRLLNDFSHISVREEKSIPELTKIGMKNVYSVLDPVFLLETKDWESISGKRIIKEKYILSYVLSANPDYYSIVDSIAEELNVKIVHFGLKNKKYKNNTINYYNASPIEFLNLIKNAECVITTSFHATAFSIIFNKKFITVPYQHNGDRILDLLNKLSLRERCVKNYSEYNSELIKEGMNYKKTNQILSEIKKESREWLDNALEK